MTMNYEQQQELLDALRDSRKYIKQAHDSAEDKHDSYGELYQDSVQYEIMQETESLLERIDRLLAVDKFSTGI